MRLRSLLRTDWVCALFMVPVVVIIVSVDPRGGPPSDVFILAANVFLLAGSLAVVIHAACLA
jgi:hypothetical protein